MRVLVSGEYPKLKEALEARGISCIPTKCDQRLPKPVAFHPDLQFLPINKAAAFILKGSRWQLPQYTLTETMDFPGNVYPGDCLCNCLFLGPYHIFNPVSTDKAVLLYSKQNSFTPIPVKQGYTRCSVCSVNSSAIITADCGIAKAVKGHGIKLLSISPGHVSLPGYDTGFFGGACGKLGGSIYFAGSLNFHPQGEDVRKFCAHYNVPIVELWQGPLLDVGGIIELAEGYYE